MPRKTNKIKPKKTILLIVEGYTEKIYFSQMKIAENNQNISIVPRISKHSSLSTILETAIKEKRENIYDDICCVFDRDVLVNNGISNDLHKKLMKQKRIAFNLQILCQHLKFGFYCIIYFQKIL